MESYAAIGGLLLLLGVLFGLIWKFGRSAGAVRQQADSAEAGLAIEKEMARAAATAPSDLEGVEDAARRGEF
jgi:hypothetical protein